MSMDNKNDDSVLQDFDIPNPLNQTTYITSKRSNNFMMNDFFSSQDHVSEYYKLLGYTPGSAFNQEKKLAMSQKVVNRRDKGAAQTPGDSNGKSLANQEMYQSQQGAK